MNDDDFYEPKNTFSLIEPMTTANKHITSNFDKSDSSYLVKESEKYPIYSFQPLSILVLPDSIIIPENFKVTTDIISRILKSSRSKQPKDDMRDSSSSILGEFSRIAVDSGFFGTEAFGLINKINQRLFEIGCIPYNSFVQVVFYDWLNRNQIVDLTNLLLKMIRFRGIMLLPFSLATLIGRNSFRFGTQQSTTAVVRFSEDIVCFIDDYTLIDVYVHRDSVYYDKRKESIRIGCLDISEEFTRLRVFRPNLKYYCNICNHGEADENKIRNHLLNSKKCNNGYYVYDSDEKDYDKSNRLRALGIGEKIKQQNVIEVDIFTEDDWEISLRGACILKELDISKELWLTDIEWKVGMLKKLKEKLLFYI